VAQTVTVRAIDDYVVEPAILHWGQITAIVASTDIFFDAKAVTPVNTTVYDNDGPRVNVTQSGGSTLTNENGITEYVDYLGTKYTFDPTTKKWKSNGRVLTENYLQDLELSEQEGVGDAADDSGGGKKRSIAAPVTSAIVGVADYTGMPESITSGLDYEVWATTWVEMFEYAQSQYEFGNPSYNYHSVVSSVDIRGNEYNGFRPPEDVSATSIPSVYIDEFKDKFDLIPAGRRAIKAWYWLPDVGCYTNRHHEYYKIPDGTTYLNERVLTCWLDQNSDDCADSFEAFLIKCRDAGFTFDYIINDQEAQDNYWIDGRNSYAYSGVPTTPQDEAQADARRISAIVADDSFDLYVNPVTNKTFAEEFMENYQAIRTQTPGYTADPRTIEQILAPFLGVTGITNYVSTQTYWQAYGCAGGCEPDGRTIGGLDHPEGYNLYFHVAPAWRATADSWHYNVYLKKFRDVPQQVSDFEHVIHMEYNVDPVNEVEARFYQGSNLEVYYQKPVLNTYSGMSRYFAGFYNLVYPNYNFPVAYALESDWSTTNAVRSGYVLNPQDDTERYNFCGYLVNDYKGPAGEQGLVRYPETIPYDINGERDDALLPEWETEYNFKTLVHLIKLTRHHLRSDPTHWQRFAPWVAYASYVNARWGSGDVGYYHELLRHILVHGARIFQIFSSDYNPFQVSTIHDILDEWRHISGNSRAQPCSNSTGSVDDLVDRVLLHEAFENVLVSGGRLVNNPNEYIWRISVAPKHFVNNICTLYRQNDDSDLPETITIDKTSAVGQRRGVWIRRFTQGVPQYAVAGYNP
jgi:hypothetical protein